MEQTSLNKRLENEVLHGATPIAVAQAEYGWDSAAGKIRMRRRADFLTQGLTKSDKVLEIGAGTGLQTKNIIGRVGEVVGIDISDNLLNIARKKAPGAHYQVMDAHKLEFAAESFDAVLGVSILHHLEWDKCLTECFRVLKPGGVARFSEPNLLNPQIYLQKNIPYLKRMAGDSPDEYAFTRWQAKKSFEKCGFERVKVRPFEFLHPSTPEKWISFVVKLEQIISATPLVEIGGSLLMEAYKPRS